jgi:hypothetical protein
VACFIVGYNAYTPAKYLVPGVSLAESIGTGKRMITATFI